MQMTGNAEETNEFSPRYKRGSWAARLETQDVVAAIVAVEAIAGIVELVPPGVMDLEARILFEAHEDFEIRWKGGLQQISVKDKQVGYSEVKQIVANLEIHIVNATLRLEAASLTAGARSLGEDIVRLRALKASISNPDDFRIARSDFERQHNVSADLALRTVLSERRLGDNPGLSQAVFAGAMRKAFVVHNYSDKEISLLLSDLTNNLLAQKRRQRGALDLADLERILLTPLVPLAIAGFETHYFRTDFGYLPDSDRKAEIRYEQRTVIRAANRLMRDWRRRTFWRRLQNWFFYVGCPCCNHALIANLNGRYGLACPRCGYQPYFTVFWACDCGGVAVIQRQPDLTSFMLVRDAVNVLRLGSVLCEKCQKPPRPEHFVGRIFGLRIPHPANVYTSQAMIDIRKQLGWKGATWKESSNTPREEMIRQTLDQG
jgi:hypothetical protein